MHTEHLRNVSALWAAVGWLIAVAVASLVGLAMASLGLLSANGEGSTGWTLVAVVIGFFVGGSFTGMRTVEAPILHGVAMGLMSLVAAALLNLVADSLLGTQPYTFLAGPAVLTYLLAQIAAAVLGTWSGYTFALRGAEESQPPEP